MFNKKNKNMRETSIAFYKMYRILGFPNIDASILAEHCKQGIFPYPYKRKSLDISDKIKPNFNKSPFHLIYTDSNGKKWNLLKNGMIDISEPEA